MRRAFWIFLTALACGLALSGCAELGYYRQAAVGQWDLLRARRPVAEVLADPETAPELRRRLERAQTMRAFASKELGLPENGSYRHYADLGRPQAVKNVFAASELSLEPRRWCYLTVGCLSYRGYFDAEAARRLAAELRAAGDDVYVADIPAYSTLGWFDDPLLNTFVHWPVGRLAELMFHELAHQRLYVGGDSAFDEAFATAVGRLGAERWLASQGSAEEREAYALDSRRREQFLQAVTKSREELAAVYDASRPDAAKRLEKRRILAELRERYRALKQSWGGYAGYDRWFDQDLNNAKLAGHNTYYHWVPAFMALHEQEGRDFAAFYRAAGAIASLSPPERAARLTALAKPAPALPGGVEPSALQPLITDRTDDERRAF
ncbi:MAG: aminopeptidase [Candidatus Competibacteraceae bacterium]|nr:aminopeptidase [Candidatus Competibacteraceae bacterium]